MPYSKYQAIELDTLRRYDMDKQTVLNKYVKFRKHSTHNDAMTLLVNYYKHILRNEFTSFTVISTIVGIVNDELNKGK